MSRDNTIKAYVERRLAQGGGASLEQVWRDVREEFPHRAPGWNYVQKIEREFNRRSFDEETE